MTSSHTKISIIQSQKTTYCTQKALEEVKVREKILLDKSEQKVNPQKIVVVFDLDQTLVVGYRVKNQKQLPELKPLSYIQIADGQHYLVLPGALALIRKLFDLIVKKEPDLRICFFSCGEKKRNESLIEKLLILALGNEHYQTIKENVPIYSVDDAEIDADNTYKKNLKKTVLKPGESLDSVILIDDNPLVLLPTQRRNGLLISSTTHDDISDASKTYCTEENLCNVNHLFYATSVLKELFSSISSSGLIADKLFNLQYEKEEVPFSLTNPGFFLVAYSNERFTELMLNQSILSDLSKKHDGMPLLIKVGDNRLFLYSQPDEHKEWGLKRFDSELELLKPIIYYFNPCDKEGDSTQQYSIFPTLLAAAEICFKNVIEEIFIKRYHKVFQYRLKDNLYEERSHYLDGFKELQKYDDTLTFSGFKANSYFGLSKELSPISDGIKHTLLASSSLPIENSKNNITQSFTP